MTSSHVTRLPYCCQNALTWSSCSCSSRSRWEAMGLPEMNAGLCEELSRPPLGVGQGKLALRRGRIAQRLDGDDAAGDLVRTEYQRMARAARIGPPELRLHVAPTARARGVHEHRDT